MSSVTVGPRTRKSDYDAAQALLDLQGNWKPEENLETNGLSRQCMKDDPAKIFWNCFVSSDVAAPSSDSYQTKKLGYVNSKGSSNVSNLKNDITESSQSFYTCSSSPVAIPCFKNEIISSIRAKNNINEVRKSTREIGTQTEEPFINPNILLMEATIQNLYEKIKLLEAQVKNSPADSDGENQLIDNANEATFSSNEMDSYSFDEYDHDPDYDVVMEEDNKRERKYPSYLQSKKTVYESKENSRKSENIFPARVLTNHNINSKSQDMVPIGEGHATVPSRILKHINWNSYSSATRKLLTAVFSRRILATHSLTGKPSPAFPNKPAKKRLNPELVNDIVQTVVERCSVPENVVRTSITTKCADESKMLRTREINKKRRNNKKNRENVPPTTTSDSGSEDY